MCGIAGCFDPAALTPGVLLRHTAGAMADRLTHRGPDEGGLWTDPAGQIGLGFRRLSILDLSPAGSQPMHSACGRFTIAFNGEIYNHAELRADLTAGGLVVRGHSDTEVLLEAIARWGVCAAVERTNGMFAFAVWDARERSLTLVRDRLGIKPLYYAWLGTQFVFSSELKAIAAHPKFRPEVDRRALSLFLQHSYIPAPLSIYQGIRKLPPGCLLTISAKSTPETSPTEYWTLRAAIERGQTAPFIGSSAEAVDQLETLLREAIAWQRVADVPVGAFLSGGIDSSVVVALMQAAGSTSVQAFTIGFAEPEFDEAPFAESIARHLGVEHTVQIVTPEQAREVIPRLPEIYDEPFADASQIPTFLVSQLARQRVTVSLSGDGGDELFVGYDRYRRIDAIWRQIAWCPAPLRKLAAGWYQQVVHRGLRGRQDESHRARALAAANQRELYEALHRHWNERNLVIGSASEASPSSWRAYWIGGSNFIEEMMALDTATYLPDCILTKLDRASMAVSLEARVPLLDHRVVEFAWTLPPGLKCRDGQGKWPLREILARYVPRNLFERPKRGFGVPIDQWLRGPLRDWAESLLSTERLAAEGFLRPEPIRQKWREHLEGKLNWQYLLWDVLMFQAWLESASRKS